MLLSPTIAIVFLYIDSCKQLPAGTIRRSNFRLGLYPPLHVKENFCLIYMLQYYLGAGWGEEQNYTTYQKHGGIKLFFFICVSVCYDSASDKRMMLSLRTGALTSSQRIILHIAYHWQHCQTNFVTVQELSNSW